MKSNLIQIDDLRAVELVICSNVESVADGHYFGPFADEAVAAAISAAQRVISNALGCYVADEDPLFANWHGGKRCRDDLRVGWVHANLYARELDVDDNGEEVFGDWLWAGGQARRAWREAEVTPLETYLAAANDAMEAELVAQEAAIQAERDKLDGDI